MNFMASIGHVGDESIGWIDADRGAETVYECPWIVRCGDAAHDPAMRSSAAHGVQRRPQFVRRIVHERQPPAHDRSQLPRRVIEREHRKLASFGGVKGELRCNAEVSAATPANGPEQVGLGFRRQVSDRTIRGNHPGGCQLVAGQPEPTSENPYPAAEGQSRDTHGGTGTAGKHPAGPGDSRIDIYQTRPRPDLCPRPGHRDRCHTPEIDHQSVIRNAIAGKAVTTAACRDRDPSTRCELHAARHILLGGAEGNRSWMIRVEKRIERPRCRIKPVLATQRECSGHPAAQVFPSRSRESILGVCRCASGDRRGAERHDRPRGQHRTPGDQRRSLRAMRLGVQHCSCRSRSGGYPILSPTAGTRAAQR